MGTQVNADGEKIATLGSELRERLYRTELTAREEGGEDLLRSHGHA